MPGLRTAIYKVTDLPAAKDWYAKLFRTQPYFDEVFYVGFSIGGFELGLIPDEANGRADNILVYWDAADVPSEYERALSFGAAVHEEPHEVGGGIVVASAYDPWGNVVGFIYNPHFVPEK